MSRTLASLATLLVIFLASAARADMYTYTDRDGVMHFTNITPRGKDRAKWKVLYKTGPGKSAAIRGGCPRCDRVPATDRSRDRYTRYDAFIAEAAELYQIPETLIRAIIKVESDYDPRVVSAVGAMGLMQLMPSNVKEDRVSDPFDPRENILGGTRQLRRWANKYKGDLILTLAAYSAGPGAVKKYGEKVPPYETTQRYIRMVLKEYDKQKARFASAR
jgi:soluble lytic murein transglycosylase-like protein